MAHRVETWQDRQAQFDTFMWFLTTAESKFGRRAWSPHTTTYTQTEDTTELSVDG